MSNFSLLKLGCKYTAEMAQKLYFAGKWGEKRTLQGSVTRMQSSWVE